MELVMPNNYVVLEEEEMMYLDGGDWNNFRKNIQGLWARTTALRFALRESGLTNYAGQVIVASYPILMAKVASISTTVLAITGIAGLVAAVGLGAALYGWRLFY
ncbi:hypothetical protein [Streptococcus suis]|uniref:hypothetical protein n=1 Tax=Streptococcus suis TaxID=1307 RepID=UPI0003F994EE|nr:hypothetical protein [Streptococcus suis]